MSAPRSVHPPRVSRRLQTLPSSTSSTSAASGSARSTRPWTPPRRRAGPGSPRSHGTPTLGSYLAQAIRAGPRREFQSPLRGRGLPPRHQCPNADCGPGQTPSRATRTTARTASLPQTNTLYTSPRTHAASCCSLRVRAPAPPGWKLPGFSRDRRGGPCRCGGQERRESRGARRKGTGPAGAQGIAAAEGGFS